MYGVDCVLCFCVFDSISRQQKYYATWSIPKYSVSTSDPEHSSIRTEIRAHIFVFPKGGEKYASCVFSLARSVCGVCMCINVCACVLYVRHTTILSHVNARVLVDALLLIKAKGNTHTHSTHDRLSTN